MSCRAKVPPSPAAQALRLPPLREGRETWLRPRSANMARHEYEYARGRPFPSESIPNNSGDAGGGTIETERSCIHVGRRACSPDRIAGQVCAARGLLSLLLVYLFFAKKR